MEHRLQAYIAAQKVGELVIDSACHFQFYYSSEWLSNEYSFPISLSMPLKSKVYKGKRIDAFFHFLLGVSDKQTLYREEIIKKLKCECPGGLSFFEENHFPEEGKGQYSLINQNTFHTLINSATVDGRIVKSNEFGQKIISIVTHKGNLYVPNGPSPGMYLLKTASDRLPGIVENEYICMRLARKAGLRVGGVKIQKHENQHYLLSERTDRLYEHTQLSVIHQESIAQSLGATRISKKHLYTYKNLMKLIQANSIYPGRDKIQALKLIIFALIIGYTEFTLEKIYLDIGRESLSLAKISGLLSTLIYGPCYASFKMLFKGEEALENITVEKLKGFCQDINAPYKLFRAELMKMVDLVKNELESLSENLIKDVIVDKEFLEKLKSLIKSRCLYIKENY